MCSLSLIEPVKEWAGIGLGTDGKFRIDGSALKAGYKCSTQAVLRYGWGLTAKAERANLLAGTAMHAAIAHYLDDGPVANALVCFDHIYKDWAQINVAPDDKLSWQNTRLITQKWLEAHPSMPGASSLDVKGWPFSVTHVEVPFEVPLAVVDGVEILFVGRMDVVGEYNGYPVVVDHKSTGFINQQWTEQWAMDGQVTGYVHAARQVLAKPVIGAFINGVQFSKLPSDPTRKCKDHGVKYAECGPMHAKWETVGLLERNEQQVENWLAEAVPMAGNLYKLFKEVGDNLEEYLPSLAMEGQFTGECRWCEFRKGVCEIGRRPAVARAGLEFSPWNPLEV